VEFNFDFDLPVANKMKETGQAGFFFE